MKATIYRCDGCGMELVIRAGAKSWFVVRRVDSAPPDGERPDDHHFCYDCASDRKLVR